MLELEVRGVRELEDARDSLHGVNVVGGRGGFRLVQKQTLKRLAVQTVTVLQASVFRYFVSLFEELFSRPNESVAGGLFQRGLLLRVVERVKYRVDFPWLVNGFTH